MISTMALAWLASACSSSPRRYVYFDGGPLDGRTGSNDAAAANLRPDGGPILPPADRQVVLPFGAPPTALRYSVTAAPAMLDVQLSIDTTGSFVEEIAAVQSTLEGVVVPAIRARVPDTSFGVSYFQDFPTPPFGASTDLPFVLLQRVTGDLGTISAAVSSLDRHLGDGGDLPEAGYEAIYQATSGGGYSGGGLVIPPFSGAAASGGGTEGGCGFRRDSFRVIVHATDALAHDPTDYAAVYPGTHGRDAALAAMLARRVRFVGIASGDIPRPQLEDLAIATGAVIAPTGGSCPTGVDGAARAPVGSICPLVFDVLENGTGMSSALSSALTELVDQIAYASVQGSAGEDRLGFVKAIAATSATPPAGAPAPGTSDSTPGDGYPDTFVDVHAGTMLDFDVILANDLLVSQTYEQTFRVEIRIVADGAVIVDSFVRIVVPASM